MEKEVDHGLPFLDVLIDNTHRGSVVTWLGFHKDIVNLVFILRKNLFPVHLIDKCVYRYLNTAIDRNGSIQNTTSQGKQYFYKLPYLGRFSTIVLLWSWHQVSVYHV